MLFRLHGKVMLIIATTILPAAGRAKVNDPAPISAKAAVHTQPYFVPNEGQWQPDIRFMVHAGGGGYLAL